MTAMSRKEIEQEMKDAFGFVPEFYKSMPDCAYAHAWGMHRDFELPKTALDNKTKELIGLAVASHIKCKYCIYFHSKAARFFGAGEQEVREAIGMSGVTVLFSNALTGTQVDYEQFRREVDRALEHVASSMKK